MKAYIRKVAENDAKLFFTFLYGATLYDWIRRQDNRYAINVKLMREARGQTNKEIEATFNRLQNIGWVYNYRSNGHTAYFSVSLPEWLTISEDAKLTERYVPKDKKYGEDESTNMTDQFRHPDARDYTKNHYAEERKRRRDEHMKKLIEKQVIQDGAPLTVEEILGEETNG